MWGAGVGPLVWRYRLGGPVWIPQNTLLECQRHGKLLEDQMAFKVFNTTSTTLKETNLLQVTCIRPYILLLYLWTYYLTNARTVFSLYIQHVYNKILKLKQSKISKMVQDDHFEYSVLVDCAVETTWGIKNTKNLETHFVNFLKCFRNPTRSHNGGLLNLTRACFLTIDALMFNHNPPPNMLMFGYSFSYNVRKNKIASVFVLFKVPFSNKITHLHIKCSCILQNQNQIWTFGLVFF